ncbi:hypothetical protein [Alkaliphilus sp. B6464]|uniref:hypothetical protein n=1 Tax=Alkaliphilus sp. B6464 TaxID=2731219 RepID=UPI001BA9FEB7|nr:hypothetical protein [Alkaliphilus sp. B6464]QUH21051.1 hypothetical protein HYG84_14985 [Alkaliphilus sp. B6464]
MDFGSIIGFIAIIFITSLFNKDKKVAKRQVQPNKPSPAQRTVKKASNTSETRRKTFSGGLEDLFNELKVEFDKNFGDTEKKQSSSTSQQNIINEDDLKRENEIETLNTTFKDGSKDYKGGIYGKEIGKEEIPIEFNRESIIQGVIMSEILQKPKSLRR